jgi:hypothetical protein
MHFGSNMMVKYLLLCFSFFLLFLGQSRWLAFDTKTHKRKSKGVNVLVRGMVSVQQERSLTFKILSLEKKKKQKTKNKKQTVVGYFSLLFSLFIHF